MTRIISQKDAATPGRPGIKKFSPGPTSGKASDIRIVKRDIPASGINQVDDWSETEDVVGNPTPTIISGSQRPGARGQGTGDSRTRVRDRSVNRSIDVR